MRNFQPFARPGSITALPVDNLERRVAMQRAALQQAEDDLARARGLQPAPRSPPSAPSDPQALADQIILAGARRRGEAPMGPSAAQQPNLRVVTDPTDLAKRIVNAGRKARNEPPL